MLFGRVGVGGEEVMQRHACESEFGRRGKCVGGGGGLWRICCDVRRVEIECTRWFFERCVVLCVQVGWFVGGGCM
jgi:hypothetical protein